MSTEDTAWAWLWDSPIELRLDANDIQELADNINLQRAEKGILETHGPVCVKQRKITVGEWED